MSRSYEISRAHQTPVYIVAPHESYDHDLDDVVYGEGVVESGEVLPETDTHVLVTGRPYALAFGVVGTPEQLRAYAKHISEVIARHFPSEGP